VGARRMLILSCICARENLCFRSTRSLSYISFLLLLYVVF
jgi:hypothetical protein